MCKDDGGFAKEVDQIASDTCLDFKADLWGMLAAGYTPSPVADAAALDADHQAEVGNRMPTRPLSALAQDYPGTDPAKFAAPNGIDPQHVSLVGFVIDGVHYSGGCTTRRGAYTYCESLVVPSYSTATSAFAGLALMRLEATHPGNFASVYGGPVSRSEVREGGKDSGCNGIYRCPEDHITTT